MTNHPFDFQPRDSQKEILAYQEGTMGFQPCLEVEKRGRYPCLLRS